MRDVLQSTARKFKIFMADSTTPTQGKTGLSSFTVYLAKDGGAENTVSPTINERGHGWYEVTPTTAHRDTLGENAWTFIHAGAVDFPMKETVVLYDGQLAAVGANTTAPATPTNVSDAQTAIITQVDANEAKIDTLLSRLTSDRAGKLDNLDIAISVIQSQITALNNLSAKVNWFGALLLEVPDAGTREYLFELVNKDDEDKLANLDGLPTITLVNSAGTDRSSLITTGIANPSTGRYTLTITVGVATANEGLKLAASGAISAENRYAVIMPQVVDYDSATQINTILTRLGTPSVTVSDDVAAIPAASRDAILNRVLAGNHDTAGTVGKVLQFLDVLLSTRATPAQVTAALDAISATALARFITVDTGQTSAAAGSVAAISQGAAAALVLRGGLTHAQAVDLLVAAAIGLSSQPTADDEKFLFRDGADAFTTTFDENGNRTAVVLH